MRNLLDGLEEAGLALSNVVATNVYLDDIERLSANEPDIRPVFPGCASHPHDSGATRANRTAHPERG